MLRFALSFAAAGIPVHPLHTPTPGAVAFDGSPRPCSCNRAACERPGKEPRTAHGSHDATTDTTRIEAWWRRWPESNVGAATGRELPRGGHLAVIDVDRDHCGFESLAFLFDELERLPATLTVRTGGGGAHYYMRTRYPLRNRASVLPGIDVRGVGGYVVAPPSLHASGGRYQIATGSLDQIAWLSDGWLTLLGTRPVANAAAPDEWVRLVEQGVAEGGRNDAVARLAGLLIARGLHGRVALALVSAWNDARNRPPLPHTEVEQTVRSIAAREVAKREETSR